MRFGILGAGVSGLTAGRLLVERGHEIAVFEKESVPGGLCRTETRNGFVHDISGGHVLHSRNRAVLAQIIEWAGASHVLSHHRNTKIFCCGRYVKYPFENGLSDLPDEDRLECLRDYVDAFYRRAYTNPPAPETFLAWCRYRFGAAITDKFMEPYNQKIWKVPLDELGSAWVGGRVPDAPLDDVLRAALGMATEGYQHQAIFQYPARGGYQFFTDRIGEPILEHVRLNTPVERIEEAGGRVRVNGESFDRVISTIPVQQIVSLLNDVPAAVRAQAASCRYLSILTILIGCRGEPRQPFSWVYLPSPEQGPANRVTYLSQYSPANAPRGTHSLMAEITFLPGREPDHADAVKATVEGMARAGLLDPAEVVHTATATCAHAYHLMDLGFEGRREELMRYLEGRSIIPLGRFGSLRYVNIDQAVEQVMDWAATIPPARRA